MTTPHDKALLPCPFCGYNLTVDEGVCEGYVPDTEEEESEFTGICCPGCAVFLSKPKEHASVEDGIDAWNRRAPIPEAGNGGDGWLDISSAPTDGTKFDAWCRHPEVPEASGVRFTDVQMRGDKSGFGFVIHLRDGAHWHYLDARDPDSIYPAWFPTHWRPLPAPPSTPSNEGREKA